MENTSLDICINEKCAFCMKSFTCLRTFVEHLDKYCKIKKDLDKTKSRLNKKQRRTITCKDDWCKHSTEQLNQQLKIIKGTKVEKCSVAEDTRSYNNGMMKGGSKGATPELAPTSHNGGEGDEGNTESGSSITNSRAFIHHRRLIHK